MSEQIHVMVGTPCYGGAVTDNYMTSFLNTQSKLASLGIKVSRISLGSESLIPRGRNRLVHSYLCSGATHYLQIDADIEWEPEAVLGLLQSKKRVCACAYPIKNVNWTDVVAAAKRNDPMPERFATKLAINPLLDGATQQTDGLSLRVRDTATGFLMIERDVFIEMMDQYPELFYFSDVGPGTSEYGLPLYTLFDCQIINEKLWDGGPVLPRYLSEDYLFCRRWQQMGGEIWLYLGANLNHIGTMKYRGDVTTAFQILPSVDQTAGAQVVTPTSVGGDK